MKNLALSIFMAFIVASMATVSNGFNLSIAQNSNDTSMMTMPDDNMTNMTTSASNMSSIMQNQEIEDNSTHSTSEHMDKELKNMTGKKIVRDSATILLSGQTIPSGDYIHLYDSSPFYIANGHVAAKIPCDDDSNSTLSILTGVAPNLIPAELELLQNLSSPGEQCLYHVDLGGNTSMPVTDVAIMNNGDDDVEFPATSSVVIGVNAIIKGEHEDHGEHSGDESGEHGVSSETHSEETNSTST